MKLVLITGDEFSSKEIEETLAEQDLTILNIFDDGCKVLVEVKNELPNDPDYKDLEVIDYWYDVFDELFNPCCTAAGNEVAVQVMKADLFFKLHPSYIKENR